MNLNQGADELNSFKSAVRLYSELRALLYEQMNSRYPGFNFTPVSLNDAITANSWKSDETKDRGFIDWISCHRYYNAKSRFKRFDLSVKSASDLVSIAYGMPSRGKTKLNIDVIEATPIANHKMGYKAFEVISTAAQIYGVLLGADEIRIMRPINDKVMEHYCKLGYEFCEPAKKSLPVYCSMSLAHHYE